jgi:hypothetical protein
VPLVSNGWDISFARIETTKKAIAERGWGQLNRSLLLHPDLQRSVSYIIGGATGRDARPMRLMTKVKSILPTVQSVNWMRKNKNHFVENE